MSNRVLASIGFVLVIMVVLVFTLKPQEVQSQAQRTPTPSYLVTPGGPVQSPRVGNTPPPTRDLDPRTDYRQKWQYLVRHPNGALEVFLVPPSMSRADLARLLGPGDTIVGESPAPAAIHPPSTPPSLPPGVFPSRAPITPTWFPPPPTQAP